MSISPEYKLSHLRHANIRSWLSTFASLGQRVRDITPSFSNIAIASPADQPNKLLVDEVHIDRDNNDRPQPHITAVPSQPSHTAAPTSAPPTIRRTPDTREQLSAAIEVKFLLPVLKPGRLDVGFPSDLRPILAPASSGNDTHLDIQSLTRQAHESIASTIRHHAQSHTHSPASASSTTAPHPHPLKSVTLHNISAAGQQERDYWDSHWIVKRANSAEPSPRETQKGDSYLWVPVEVCSPKLQLSFPSSSSSSSSSSSPGLAPLLATVTSVIRALSSHHRVTVNYTCDVHVHVGRADSAPLALETLKRLATMLWLAEDVVRSIRDPESPNYENVYTWGAELTRHSRLAKIAGITPVESSQGRMAQIDRNLSDGTFLEALRREDGPIARIWGCDSHLRLGRLLSGSTAQYRRLGFNFSSLGEEDERARNGPKTVEFRVLEGTVDEDVVAAWIDICWGLVEVAGEGKDDRFVRVVRACLGDEVDEGLRGKDDGEEGGRHVADIRIEGLRALAVYGLGVGGEVYDAFIRALLRRRGM